MFIVETMTLKTIDLKALKKRFWTKVDIKTRHSCWKWKACADPKYGLFRVGSRKDKSMRLEKAHRVAWEITNGSIPEGISVCHDCDNPLCCNPTHLFLGDNSDNSIDMAQKLRSANLKLTIKQVLQIRASRESQTVLAQKFGISQQHISEIQTRKKWRWLA